MIELLEKAATLRCQLVVFPEMALTTFFPRWSMANPDEANDFCESEMPSKDTQPLFDAARQLGVGFCLGYAELEVQNGVTRRFNSSILIERDGTIVGKYRKVHICGLPKADPTGCEANFEKSYFMDGNLGFPVFEAFDGLMGMCICNDRRWPETYRVMALKGAELIMVGYNTGATRRTMVGNSRVLEPTHLPAFHNELVMQAGAYQNGCWVVGVAKAGLEDGQELLGGTCIISPLGDIVAKARTLEDELIVADCDLDAGKYNQRTIFNFETERRIGDYSLITTQRGIAPQPE
jgi:predicted amidohydrolase